MVKSPDGVTLRESEQGLKQLVNIMVINKQPVTIRDWRNCGLGLGGINAVNPIGDCAAGNVICIFFLELSKW